MQYLHKLDKSLTKKRSNRAVSLMYVVVVGGVTASAALALGANLFPVYNHVSSLALRDEVIDAAESAMSYSLAKLNKLGAEGEALESIPVQNLQPPLALSGLTNITVELISVDLSKLPASLYSPEKFTELEISNPEFRLLKVTAHRGSFRHVIRSLLAPVYNPPLLKPYSINTNGTSSNPSPFFTGALQANDELTLGRGIDVAMNGNEANGANISSNGIISLEGLSKISGNVNAYASFPSGNKPTTLRSSASVEVRGDVQSSGNIINSDAGSNAPPFVSDQTGGNVFGDGIPSKDKPTFGDINDQASRNQLAPIELPQASQLAEVTSSSQTGPTAVSMPSSNAKVADLGNLKIASGQTVTIEPGTYVVDSVTIESGGTLTLKAASENTANVAKGVDLYIRGTGNDNSPIDIKGSINSESGILSPNNLQIFYGGAKDVSINVAPNSSISGLLYAPMANVGITFGKNSSYRGAVSGRRLTLSRSPDSQSGDKGTFIFDPKAVNNFSPSSSTAQSPGYKLNLSATKTISVQSYRQISWEEAKL